MSTHRLRIEKTLRGVKESPWLDPTTAQYPEQTVDMVTRYFGTNQLPTEIGIGRNGSLFCLCCMGNPLVDDTKHIDYEDHKQRAGKWTPPLNNCTWVKKFAHLRRIRSVSSHPNRSISEYDNIYLNFKFNQLDVNAQDVQDTGFSGHPSRKKEIVYHHMFSIDMHINQLKEVITDDEEEPTKRDIKFSLARLASNMVRTNQLIQNYQPNNNPKLNRKHYTSGPEGGSGIKRARLDNEGFEHTIENETRSSANNLQGGVDINKKGCSSSDEGGNDAHKEANWWPSEKWDYGFKTGTNGWASTKGSYDGKKRTTEWASSKDTVYNVEKDRSEGTSSRDEWGAREYTHPPEHHVVDTDRCMVISKIDDKSYTARQIADILNSRISDSVAKVGLNGFTKNSRNVAYVECTSKWIQSQFCAMKDLRGRHGEVWQCHAKRRNDKKIESFKLNVMAHQDIFYICSDQTLCKHTKHYFNST